MLSIVGKGTRLCDGLSRRELLRIRDDASTTTVSMLLYANARGAPTPALNAIATVGLVITLATLTAAFLVYRKFAGGQEATSLAALEV